MADVISRLRLDSGEFDSKIKRAGQELMAYSEHCKKMGLEMGYANKDAKEFAKALGSMQTTSSSARGKINELTEAFVNLKVMYKNMTDEEKNNAFGKNLAASLDQLKTRIDEAKQNLNSVNAELGNTKQSEDGAKSGLEGLTSALGINVKSLAGWGAALAAGKVALDVAKDAFFASEANVDEWGRTVQSAQSVYEGFLISINNGDISGFLSRMDDIVKAARAAYNELDTLGTMKTIQAPKVSAQQTENERIRSMIQTGRYIAPVDGRRNAVFNGREMQNGDKLTAGQIRALEKQLQNGMQNVVKLVGNEVKQTGKAIDAYYDSIAKQNGMSLQEFKKGTSTWEEFSKKMQGYEQYKEWDKQARTEFAKQGGRGNVDFDKSNPFAEFRKWGTFRVDKMGENSYNDLVRLIQQRDQQAGQAYGMQSQAYRTMNRAEGFTVSKLMGNGGKSKQQQAEDKVTAALQDYQQIIDKASLELKSGAVTEADVKKKQLSAQERLYDAYGDAYALYKDPKYKDAQDKAAEEIVKLGGEVKAATEAQEAARKAARELESAQKKLADAQKELANAQASGDLKQIYAAEKKVETAQQSVTQSSIITVKVEGKEALEQLQKLEGIQTVKVNVEEGNVNLPQVPTNDETIKVNVEQGKIDLPEVPTDDKTIRVNVEQGNVNLPQVPTNDETIKVNVEQGKIDLPEVPTDDKTIRVNVEQGNVNLPQVPTNDETIKVNVEQGKIDLPEVPTDDKTIRVNVEQGNVNLPQVPTDDQTIKVNVVADNAEAIQSIQQLEGVEIDVPVNYKPQGGILQPVDIPLTASNIDAVIANIKEKIVNADLGSSAALSLQEGLSDATAIGTILQTAIQNGIDTAQFDTSGLMQKLMSHKDISDDDIQSYVDQLNAKLKEKFDESEWPNVLITFDADTNNIVNAAKQQEKEAQKMAKDWQAAGTAIQAVGSAMSQIEDPAAKVLGTIAQAVATMALSYSQAALATAPTGWGWIAFAATGLATMISSITAIKQATSGFANGGVIPGNSMSGDNLRGMTPDGTIYGLNSQEIILNRAQQGNLSSQLEGGGIGNLHLDTVIRGEDIRLVLNNNGRRTGRGEYVQSRNSRG